MPLYQCLYGSLYLVSWFLNKIATDLFSEGWIVQIKYDDDDDEDDDDDDDDDDDEPEESVEVSRSR